MFKIISFLTIVLSCTNLNKDSKVLNSKALSQNSEILQQLILEIPIKEGSIFTKTSEENYEVPDLFDYKNECLYFYNFNENKIVKYSLIKKQFDYLTKVNQKMRENVNPIIQNVFILNNSNIVLCTFEKLIIMNEDGNMLKEFTIKGAKVGLSEYENKLMLWSLNKCYVLDIDLGAYKEQDYPSSKYIAEKYCKSKANEIFENNTDEIERLTIDTENEKVKTEVLNFPFDDDNCKEIVKESIYMHCVSPNYFVFYPWKLDDRLILVKNKPNKEVRVINIDKDFTHSILSNQEDTEGGLRITSKDDNTFYLLRMIKKQKNKVLQVFEVHGG